ncbi:MAG: hypothetical protein WCT04_15205 [Planctomycetota bacterium]
MDDNQVPPSVSQPAPVVRKRVIPFVPKPPAAPTKQVVGFYLGLVGMALLMLGAQLAFRGRIEWIDLPPSISLWQVGPFVASIGCMIFCAAYVMIWNVSLKRLILMVVLAGILVWGVAFVGLDTKARLGQQEPIPNSPIQPTLGLTQTAADAESNLKTEEPIK